MGKPKSGLLTENMIGLWTDYYEDTMGKADLDHNENKIITENYFFRKVPQGSYILTCGLEQVIHGITEGFPKTFRNEENLKWLKESSGKDFDDKFIDYLRNFEFKGDVYAIIEGTPVFPNEPVINITGPSIDVQLFESYLLTNCNSQSLIATKSSRICNAAHGKTTVSGLESRFGERTVIDFGARRQQGRDPVLERAAVVGGAVGSSLVAAGRLFGIPYIGTMAHKFVQQRQAPDLIFQESELKAFREYAESFPHNTILLVDTYDTIQGVENAIIVGKELEEKGYQLKGIRLDSGDLLDLSKKSRKMLDSAGLDYTKIYASNNLDEFTIEDLLSRGAPLDGFGVGTRMITGANYNPFTKKGGSPALGGVYKLVEIDHGYGMIPSMKINKDELEKRTLPDKKQVYRIYDKDGFYKKDIITRWDEKIKNARKLLIPIVLEGKIVYDFPNVMEIRRYSLNELSKLPAQYKKLECTKYPVELSTKLNELTNSLIYKFTGGGKK